MDIESKGVCTHGHVSMVTITTLPVVKGLIFLPFRELLPSSVYHATYTLTEGGRSHHAHSVLLISTSPEPKTLLYVTKYEIL